MVGSRCYVGLGFVPTPPDNDTKAQQERDCIIERLWKAPVCQMLPLKQAVYSRPKSVDLFVRETPNTDMFGVMFLPWVIGPESVCLSYIDPGMGSHLFQLLIAGLTGVLFFFGSLKRRWFGKGKTDPPPVEPADKPSMPKPDQPGA
jgi:hypothetical protein